MNYNAPQIYAIVSLTNTHFNNKVMWKGKMTLWGGMAKATWKIIEKEYSASSHTEKKQNLNLPEKSQ